MNITIRTQKNPDAILEAFTPPGHAKLIIQVQGHFPQDGIELDYLEDLIKLLTAFNDEVKRAVSSRYSSPYEIAGYALKNKIENFTPSLVEGYQSYAYFIGQVEPCAHCKTPMYDGFPSYHVLSLASQLLRAGWQMKSGVYSDSDGGEICHECANAGIAKFTCELCHQTRAYDLVQYEWGDPPDYLCKVCFASVTAREWHNAVEAIEKSHRYDYE